MLSPAALPGGGALCLALYPCSLLGALFAGTCKQAREGLTSEVEEEEEEESDGAGELEEGEDDDMEEGLEEGEDFEGEARGQGGCRRGTFTNVSTLNAAAEPDRAPPPDDDIDVAPDNDTGDWDVPPGAN